MAAFLFITAALFFKAPKPESQQKILEKLDSPRIPTIAFFIVGMVMMWFSASFVVIVAIVHRLSVAGMPFRDNVLVLLLSILVTALPVLIPYGAAIIGGDDGREKLERLGRWTTINGRYILGVMMFVLGMQNLLGAFGH